MQRIMILTITFVVLVCNTSQAQLFSRLKSRRASQVQLQSNQQSQPECKTSNCPQTSQPFQREGDILTVNANGGFEGQLPAINYEQPPASFVVAEPPTIQPIAVEQPVIVPKVFTLASAELQLIEAKTALAQAEAAVAQAKLAAQREAKLQAIDLRAEIEKLKLTQANQLADLLAKVEQLDPQSTE